MMHLNWNHSQKAGLTGCRSGITDIEQIAGVKSVLTQPGDAAAGNSESEKHHGRHNLHDSDLHSFLRRKLTERST